MAYEKCPFKVIGVFSLLLLGFPYYIESNVFANQTDQDSISPGSHSEKIIRSPSPPLNPPKGPRRRNPHIKQPIRSEVAAEPPVQQPEICLIEKKSDPLEDLLDEYEKIAQKLDPDSRQLRMTIAELQETRNSGNRKIYVLNEFLETEKSYSEALDFFLNRKIQPAKWSQDPNNSSPPIYTLLEAMSKSGKLSENERNFIVKTERNLKTIHELSRKLAADLEETFGPELKRVKNPQVPTELKKDPASILPVSSILKMEDRLLQSFNPKALEKPYSDFIANQEKFLSILKKWESKKDGNADELQAIQEFRKGCKTINEAKGISSPCDFSSFVIRPFQRIGKYPLLLKELSKKTKKTETSKEAMDELEILYLKSVSAIEAINQSQKSLVRKVSQTQKNLVRKVSTKIRNVINLEKNP